MDNLDRTNVAQAALAKWTLNRQLREVGVFSEQETVDDHEQFMHDFRNSKQVSIIRIKSKLALRSVGGPCQFNFNGV